jgi:hypothetical protein
MLAATSSDGGSTTGLLILYIVLYILFSLPLYAVFKKAGAEAWAAFIPIYNVYVLLKVVGRPGWWLLLFLVPILNFIILIIVYNDLSKSFGKGAGFTVGLIFLSVIFLAILGWGSAQYRGPAAGTAMTPAPPPPPPAI